MAAPSSKPQAQTSKAQANVAVPQEQRSEPAPTLAQQLAAKFIVGNYQRMATLISPQLLVTTAHVVAQSQILSQEAQEATIEFLGIQEQPRQATVVDVDETREFAVLQLETPVSIDLPADLLRPVDFHEKTKWESFWLTRDATQILVGGTVGEEQKRQGKAYLQLQTGSPVTYEGGISGAPVVAGTSLLGIIAAKSDDERGMLWYAVPVTEMINSDETEAVASLLPSYAQPAKRGRWPWITGQDFRRFSPEALDVLTRAKEISAGFNSASIHLLHLLLALQASTSGQLSELLAERGIHLGGLLQLKADAVSLGVSSVPALTKFPRISVNVRRALATAIEKAGPDGPIDESHLLYGALSASQNPTVKTLNERGITPNRVRLTSAGLEREAVLAGYQSDDATGKDLLDIKPEVEALASVLAAKDVDPPLSLGLFGDWGTGKSFFMRKLEAEIKRLGEDAKKAREQGAETAYCSNIVQIPFNAWNYIDSDLWSSLTSEIFENLAAAIVKERGLEGPGKSRDPEELAAQRELVLAVASSSEAILAEAERKKAAAEEELKQTEERLANLQKSEAAIESALTPGEILKQALGFAMQDKDMKEYVGQITKTLRISETKAAASEVQSEILELRNAWDTIVFTLD